MHRSYLAMERATDTGGWRPPNIKANGEKRQIEEEAIEDILQIIVNDLFFYDVDLLMNIDGDVLTLQLVASNERRTQ